MEKKTADPASVCSRREFLAAGISVPAVAFGVPLPADAAVVSTIEPAGRPSAFFDVDYRRLVSRGDLTYRKPASRSEEGLPVGNGRMGSLVWTSPSALKFQLNRVDVFAENSSTNSFPERHTDYGSGCGLVDIDFVDFGEDVFAGDAFEQRLSIFDALMTARGRGVTARVLAWHEHDVMAVEIDDQREQPSPINVDLRMLRYVVRYLEGENFTLSRERIIRVQTRNHSADSKLDMRNGRIFLTQQFREGTYYNGSSVAIAVLGRTSRAKYVSDSTVRLSAAAGRGRFTVLIASVSSFDPAVDLAVRANAELDAASAGGFDALFAANQTWWHDFWSKGFLRLQSSDGVAASLEQNYSFFMYLMASSSRGAYPPRFGGMLWYTNSDMREWGAQHWWANTSCYYNALPAADRFDLMDPVFAMYTAMRDSCAHAARQQWGSDGVWIPETVWFDGLETLPDDIADEMRQLYLGRKPWEQRSERFRAYAEPKHPHNSRWNWKDKGTWLDGRWVWTDKGAGPFGQVTHIFSTSAKIAYLYWLRYEYTQDRAWLRDQAYPMIKGVAEFYRNFPNVRKESDGKYHIHDVNNHEPVWCAQDTSEELSAMQAMLPIAIRASEILDIDSAMRPAWREFLENLAPLPTRESQDAAASGQPGRTTCWIGGLPPVRKGNLAAPSLAPAIYYDLCTVASDRPDMIRIANATYDAIYPRGVKEDTPITVLSRNATAAAHLGRAADLKHMLPNQLRCLAPDKDFCDWVGGGRTGVLPNRLTLREGPGSTEAERLGRVAEALQLALLQSAPPHPGGNPIIHVFPAWPREWDAQYTLLARGAFLVTSSMQRGEIEFVDVVSRAGGGCRVRNPWGRTAVTLYRNGKRAGRSAGSMLSIDTAIGERIAIVRGDTPLESLKRVI